VKILIADDEVMSRRLLQKTMERVGYEVTAVENGRLAADELCKPEGPKLALLDWMMPELDGPGVCREVRKRREHSYVYMVLLTSKEKKEDIVAGLKSGADDYLTKPFDAEELKARLRTGMRILDLEDRLVEAREEMRFQATHDALTSLWNRGMIMELLGRELSRSTREGKSAAILVGDLDHFKQVNDTYGHLVGDEVLKETARRLLSSVRSYDFAGRWGGEEFLVVLNNCDPAFSLARAQEICKTIAGKPMQTSGGPVPITMSLGLVLSHEWGSSSVVQLVHEADEALYAAKAAGRNCVRVAVPKTGLKNSDFEAAEAIRLRRSPVVVKDR
jgi:diguanylate cyclase (GGDEF)-like protein